jgi:hypothetical protein
MAAVVLLHQVSVLSVNVEKLPTKGKFVVGHQ